MRNIIFTFVILSGFAQADFWEDTKEKSIEYYQKAKAYDKEYNISNSVKAKSGEYYQKAKAYDKEYNISNRVKDSAKSSWESFKSMF